MSSVLLLRHAAARTLGGSMVQRAKAPARRVHTDERVRKEVMIRIQWKKEELYDVLSKAEEHKLTHRWNRGLLQDLSVQVAPRTYDRNWWRLRFMSRVNSFVDVAGVVMLGTVFNVARACLEIAWCEEGEKVVAQPVLVASKSTGDDDI